MKILLPLLLICSLVSKAQNAPPKKASKIIVLTKDTANNLLERISTELFDKGFIIEVKDEKSKYIITKDLPSKKWMTIYKIRARINDTSVVFSGQIAFNKDTDILGLKESSKTYWDIEYGKGGSMREAWNELDAIARKFGDNIVYSK